MKSMFLQGKVLFSCSQFNTPMKFVLQSSGAKTSPVLFGINRFFKWYNTLSLADRIFVARQRRFRTVCEKTFYISVDAGLSNN